MNILNLNDGTTNDGGGWWGLQAFIYSTVVSIILPTWKNSQQVKSHNQSELEAQTSLQNCARVFVATASLRQITPLGWVSLQTSIPGHATHLPSCSNATVFGFIRLVQQIFPFHCGYINEARTSEGDAN